VINVPERLPEDDEQHGDDGADEQGNGRRTTIIHARGVSRYQAIPAQGKQHAARHQVIRVHRAQERDDDERPDDRVAERAEDRTGRRAGGERLPREGRQWQDVQERQVHEQIHRDHPEHAADDRSRDVGVRASDLL
jgi:hypothetical protein